MIRRTRLARSGLETSRLGFGTSRLHHVGPAERARLLDCAVDLGLTHIDTAPAYGDTLAERTIGEVLAAKRNRVVIATKYGIPPDPLIAAMPQLGLGLRAGRMLLRKLGVKPKTRAPMAVAALEASVVASLRRLRTDRIDILLLHEPTPAALTDPEGMLAALERLRQKGMIRHFGLAGAWSGIAALGPCTARLGQVLQTAENAWRETEPPDISYGAVAAEPQSFGGAGVSQDTARDRLVRAISRRPVGVVLVSSRSPQRLAMLEGVASEAEAGAR